MPKKAKTTIEEKHLGYEPEVKNKTLNKVELSQALNWYNYNMPNKDLVKFLLEYIKKNYSKDFLKSIKKVPDSHIKSTYCSLSKLLLRGASLEKEEVMLKDYIENLYSRSLTLDDIEEQVKDESPKISVRDRVIEQSKILASDIDYEIDLWMENRKSNFKMYDYLNKNSVKAPQAQLISNFYTPLCRELIEAQEGKCEQLVEAYSHLTKKELQLFIDFIESIINDCLSYRSNLSKKRKPRKKKSITAEKQINNLKYKTDFNELKLTSINPMSIIGKKELWVYNTKNRQLMKIVTSKAKGFTIKGTTIQDIDEELSIKKTLRKPKETLEKLVNGGKIVLRKIMDELTTKESKTNGRINEECILLRVE